MKIKRTIGVALLFFLLQSVIIPLFCNGVTQPNIIFLAVLTMALQYGKRAGVLTALLGGFIHDVVISNFFGIHIVVYVIIAWICGYLGKSLDEKYGLITWLIALGATELSLLLNSVVLILAGQYVNILVYVWEFSVPMLIYSGIFVVPVAYVIGTLRDTEVMYPYRSLYH